MTALRILVADDHEIVRGGCVPSSNLTLGGRYAVKLPTDARQSRRPGN